MVVQTFFCYYGQFTVKLTVAAAALKVLKSNIVKQRRPLNGEMVSAPDPNGKGQGPAKGHPDVEMDTFWGRQREDSSA